MIDSFVVLILVTSCENQQLLICFQFLENGENFTRFAQKKKPNFYILLSMIDSFVVLILVTSCENQQLLICFQFLENGENFTRFAQKKKPNFYI